MGDPASAPTDPASAHLAMPLVGLVALVAHRIAHADLAADLVEGGRRPKQGIRITLHDSLHDSVSQGHTARTSPQRVWQIAAIDPAAPPFGRLPRLTPQRPSAARQSGSEV